MFDKRQILSYGKVDSNTIMPQIIDFWTRSGFYVTQMSPFQIYGECAKDEMGIKPKFNLIVNPQGDTTIFDLTVTGKISETGVIGLVLLLIFFWPLALILGLISYNKFEEKAKGYSYYFWGMMNSLTQQTGMPPGYGQPPPQGRPPR